MDEATFYCNSKKCRWPIFLTLVCFLQEKVCKFGKSSYNNTQLWKAYFLLYIYTQHNFQYVCRKKQAEKLEEVNLGELPEESQRIHLLACWELVKSNF